MLMKNQDVQMSKKTPVLALKILQGADGITKIKACHPPKVITNATLETRKKKKNRLPRYSWLSEIVCEQYVSEEMLVIPVNR